MYITKGSVQQTLVVLLRLIRKHKEKGMVLWILVLMFMIWICHQKLKSLSHSYNIFNDYSMFYLNPKSFIAVYVLDFSVLKFMMCVLNVNGKTFFE